MQHRSSPPAGCGTSVTIALLNGVRLFGNGTGQYGDPETGLHWLGAFGGTVVSAVPSGSNTVVSGTGIDGIAIHGMGLAATGLSVVATVNSEFHNWLAMGCNTAQLSINETDTSPGTGASAYNRFVKFYIDATLDEASSATSIGISVGAGTSAEDAFNNTFQDGLVYHHNGVGVSLGNCDSNTFLNINITPDSGGTGLSLALLGTNASATQNCRDNWFAMIQAQGGLTSYGTDTYTYPANNNVIMPLDTTNGVPTITLGTGSLLSLVQTDGSWVVGGPIGVGREAAFCQWFTGNGSPNGVVSAGIGSIYTSVGGGAGTTFYVKESGAGTNTGWVGK